MVAELGWLWAVDVVGDGAGVVDGSLVDGAGVVDVSIAVITVVGGWVEGVAADKCADCTECTLVVELADGVA